MLDSIKFSIISILDLYRTRAKQWYGFSLWFLIVFAILTALFSAVVIYFSANVFNIDSGILTGSFSEQLMTILSMVGQPCAYTMLLTLGLFAAYIREKSDDDESKPSLSELFAKTGGRTWFSLLVLALVVNIIYMLTYQGVFQYDIPHDRSIAYLFGSGNPSRMVKLYKWLNGLIDFIVSYVPYVGALIILLTDIYQRPLNVLATRTKTILFPVLILSFCMMGISGHAIFYLQAYVNKGLTIPFRDGYAPAILEIVMYLILSAFFFIGAAGVFLYPVMYDEKLQEAATENSDVDFQAETVEPDMAVFEEGIAGDGDLE